MASAFPAVRRILAPETALDLTIAALGARGVPSDIAADVGDSLVAADLAGKATHGLRLLPALLQDIDAGRVKAVARPELTVGGSHVVASGVRVIGYHAVRVAIDVGSEVARSTGCATVAVPGCRPCGRLGGYVERLADRGQVCLLTAGALGDDDVFVAPPGGAGRVLDTNPIAVGFPAEGAPIVVDLATSATTFNSVQLAVEDGRLLPVGVATAGDGTPTVDPAVALESGWAEPLAGTKGFALGLLAPMLAALAGDGAGLQGAFAIVIDVATRRDVDCYRATVENGVRTIASRAVEGSAPPRVPGRAQRAVQIVVAPATIEALAALGVLW
jgi:LDH2 family malate/lactate/ureidoglycolate dehydrogenase